LAIVDRGTVVAEGTPDELKAELRGDAVQVELAEPPLNGQATEVLRRVNGLSEITVEGVHLRARAEDGARAVPAVLCALESAGLSVASVTVSRPSLDDVYLRHAGRSFHSADAGEETKEVRP